jgi:hypothetical protein
MIDYAILCLYIMLRMVCSKTASFPFWLQHDACLPANDHFLSDCIARLKAKHVCLIYFIIYQLIYPH